MKKLILFIVSFAISLFLAHSTASLSNAACMTISGSVQVVAGQWPAGYSGLALACAGDNPVGPSNCGGSNATVGPGGSFNFTNCSCLAGKRPVR
jgi:hypothetical protein